MKIILKSTFSDLEIDPAEIPDAVLEQLLAAIRYGHPTGHDAVEAIIRGCRSNALAHGKKNPNNSPQETAELIKIEARGH
jgi:hypothetical protein